MSKGKKGDNIMIFTFLRRLWKKEERVIEKGYKPKALKKIRDFCFWWEA